MNVAGERLLYGNARRLWRRVAGAVAARPVILMYHRIGEDPLDPWGLCVSRENFAAHLEVIRRRRKPMRLGDLVQELGTGRCPRQAVVVTFDDGYRDNLSTALPLLEAFETPATVFCTAGCIGQEAFWWDRLAAVLLTPERLPHELAIDIGGKVMTRSLGDASGYGDLERASDRRRENDASPGSARLRLYRDVWEWLRPMAELDRATALRAITEWARVNDIEPDGSARPLSRDELLVLAGSPMVTIGAHSVTHAPLSTLTRSEQQHEIAGSKAQLESLVGREVADFAYPFGDRDVDAPTLVRDAGFRSSCTTEAEALRPRSDPFLLPRIGVGNCSGETFARMLRGLC